MLEDCSLRVSDKGNQRVRNEQRKNVHAYIQGRELHICNMEVFYRLSVPITYLPYKHASFIRSDTGEYVTEADVIIFGCGERGREVRAILAWHNDKRTLQLKNDENIQNLPSS